MYLYMFLYNRHFGKKIDSTSLRATATDSMRQSGGFKFKLASLCNDNDLFALAFKVAKEIVANDPDLCSIENSGLLSEVSKFVYTDTSTIS